MNRLIQFLFLILGITALVACNDDVTYADQVKRERSAINAYIADSAVSVISEDEFRNNNYTTDVSKTSSCSSSQVAFTCRLSVRVRAVLLPRGRPRGCCVASPSATC